MAKITLTIIDHGDAGVKVVCNPDYSILVRHHLTGIGMTQAHSYALAAIRTLQRKSESETRKKSCFKKENLFLWK